MSNGQIFISYRRDDTAGYARALYDRLVQHFSPQRVFMDVDAIEPGLAFDEVIQRALDQCEVLLVVIGRRWLDANTGEEPRINDPKDFVRLEIAAALARDIRVMPLLLDGARMPTEEELPEPLHALARRNALEVSNSRFRSDTERLISAVRKALGEPDGRATLQGLRGSKSLRYWLFGGMAIVLIGAMVYLYGPAQVQRPTAPTAPSESPDASENISKSTIQDQRPAVNGTWEAEVIYDWSNARYVEAFVFKGEGHEVYGTASFLGKERGILEGRIEKGRLRFITRTQELLGGDSHNPKEVVHRYRGQFLGNEIQFSMQTEGGYSAHIPIEFSAKKQPDPPAPPTR